MMKIFYNPCIKSKNINLMYAVSVLRGSLFFLPVLALYMQNNLFSLTNVALIFAVNAIFKVIFEIPTGSISDLFGRRNTFILSYGLRMVWLLFLFIGESMIMFILYAIFHAFTESLESGTDSAIIYDTMKDEGKEAGFRKVIGTYHALSPLGAAVSSVIGGVLASIDISLAVSVSLFPMIAAFAATVFLKEPRFAKSGENVLRHMISSSGSVFRNSRIRLIIIANLVMWGMGEVVHYMDSIFFAYKGIEIVHFGLFGAVIYGMSSIGHYYSNSFAERIGERGALIAITAFGPLFTIAATLASGYYAGIIFIIPSLFFGLKNPIIDDLINRETKSSQRATVLSMNNFMGQLGIAIFAPFVGYLAEILSINTAFMLSAIAALIVPVIFMRLKVEQ